MVTILHISDLHRSPRDPVSNDALLASLAVDRDRYVFEEPRISPPNAIVVTGDIIHGAALGAPDFDQDIAQQYAVAYKFLTELTERFVDGDRSRVILVPGNHDVIWNVARSSMEPVPTASKPADILTALTMPGSLLRWCWRTQTLFRIADVAQYDSRMAAFWEFFNRFYAGLPLAYPVGRGKGYNLFELDNGRIVVAAFDSCNGNDCFAHHGSILDGAIARSHLNLRDQGRRYQLRIAVWHHNLYGPPHRSDYMDVNAVYDMIGYGSRLGLHGHQHSAEVTPYTIYLPQRQSMAVVSAGSLCAGLRELPRGVNRQYNLIEIADDYRHARVHVRTMVAGTIFAQIHLSTFGNKSFTDLEWDPPTDPYGTPLDPAAITMRSAILEAEQALHAGRLNSVEPLLAPFAGQLPPHGRRLLIEAARRGERWPQLLLHTTPPLSIEELVLHCEALIQLHRPDEVPNILDTYGPGLMLSPATRRDLLERVAAHRELYR